MSDRTEPRIRINDLDEIESRAHEAWSEPPERLIHAQLIGNDIPNLIAEIKRLRAAKGLCFYCGHEAVAHDSGRPICGRCNSRTMSVSTL